jgi:hypothetical protein
MSRVMEVLTARSTNIPKSTLRSLHGDLAAIGLPVSRKEAGTRPAFGAETVGRVKAFQERYRLPVTGKVDSATGATLKLAALVATEADPAVLSKKLTAAAAAGPDSPLYKSFVARAALLAGDYGLAAGLSPDLTDLSDLGVNLGDGLFATGDENPSPKAPEVPFPENYYSYRHDVMAEQDIVNLRTARDVPAGDTAKNALADSAEAFLGAIEAWQQGNAECDRQRYDSAVAAYDRCQEAALGYFAAYSGYKFHYVTGLLPARIDDLVRQLVTNPSGWADIASQITWRRQLLSLAELREFDSRVIVGADPIYRADIVYQLLYANLKGRDQPFPPTGPLGSEHRKALMDARILVIAAVLVPLARAEANRLRRQYSAAREDLTRFLRRSLPLPDSTLTLSVWLACEFIEIPFARLLLVETMLDQAEAQYKARASVDDEADDTLRTADLARLAQLTQDFTDRQIPGDAGNAVRPFQHLNAAIAYAGIGDVMSADGEYVARTRQALDTLHASVTTAVASGDVSSVAFRAIGQGVTIPTVVPSGSDLPGLSSGTHPHEPYLQFSNPEPMRERNPRVYALLLQAQARLLQIWNGCNYLGYRDDYVPPWRFNYLLERARYFTEHAKNSQRDYLNFLSNAENQEFKELSAAQNVELEKANVRIESAKVDQASKEVTASKASVMQAQVNMDDAQKRLDNYREFDSEMSVFEDVSLAASVVSGIVSMGSSSIAETTIGVDKAWAERNLEKKNLQLAINEAVQAGKVALARLDVDKAGLVVAGLQRQAGLLRHEYALQNLQFMRNQTLNTEQWYRLAGGIRSVADTYLRYAIEMAFLAQQAYDFELDKRLSIIRFDYDQSEVGAMLAGDFLLRDLDTLEQDLITSQQTRQQQVRYVLSMAREFPETLQVLADTGAAMFSLRLEQLERHFPGLVALRISSVDLQPVALMDPTRVSVELTHLGTGSVRLKGQPGNSPLNSTDLDADGDWIPNVGSEWPVKIHVSGPETALFSGLSRQEAASLSGITASERGAFEGLPGASSWQIDMSMAENQVVPGTLADVIVTFTLSGYYDRQFQSVVGGAEPRNLARTSFVSARRTLPDAYYSLVHDGVLNWDISERMLSLTGTPNELRNLAVLLPLAANGPELGRCYCRYPVQVVVTAAGTASAANAMPSVTLTPAGLTLACTFTGVAGTQVSWDFGDGTPLVAGLTAQHSYARPGQYEVLIRLAREGRLVEYRAAVVVSAVHPPVAPLVVVPEVIGGAPANGTIPVTITPLAGEVSIDCAAAGQRKSATSGSVTLNLPPGLHTIDFLATRKLSGRFYSRQCYQPVVPVALSRGRVATNRTFDPDTGADNTAAPNALATRLFGNGSVVSPVDRWTLELPRDENPWFVTVSPSDVAEFDGSELSDAVLSLEFRTR